MKTKILIGLLCLGMIGCKPTYKRDNIKEAAQALALKDYGLIVDVAEAGQTIGIR